MCKIIHEIYEEYAEKQKELKKHGVKSTEGIEAKCKQSES